MNGYDDGQVDEGRGDDGRTPDEHLDVVIVGAGLSGVGAAYRLRNHCPRRRYVIFEARAALGGTWDLFRYPGVRSDSDMYTLGYVFRPWRGGQHLADGPSIRRYIEQTAAEYDIVRHIRFRTRVLAADWSTGTARWTLTVERTTPDGRTTRQTVTCRFLYSCTGYYDHRRGHTPDLPGQASYAGTVVHPQFWPDDLDHTGKRVVVIGSGATAVTLVPALAPDAAHVTMLQRSPSWIIDIPSRDGLSDRIRNVLPERPAHRLIRWKNILFELGLYQWCRRRPAAAGRMLTRLATRALGGDEHLVRKHFTPRYAPWDQRLCVVPDADLFQAVTDGTAEMVTDEIDRFVPEGIRLRTGRVLPADLVVTATGLRLLPFGGITPSVDGRPVPLADQFVWRGVMLTGLPNFALCIGYTNASWTLRADLSHRLVCRVLRYMDRHDYAAVVPRPDRPLARRPLLDLTSGYVRRAVDALPGQGDRPPWLIRQNYLLDAATTPRARLRRHLHATPRSAVPSPPPPPAGER